MALVESCYRSTMRQKGKSQAGISVNTEKSSRDLGLLLTYIVWFSGVDGPSLP